MLALAKTLQPCRDHLMFNCLVAGVSFLPLVSSIAALKNIIDRDSDSRTLEPIVLHFSTPTDIWVW